MVLDPAARPPRPKALWYLEPGDAGGGHCAAIFAYSHPGPAFGGMLMVDGFATFFRVLVIVVGILTILFRSSFLERQRPKPANSTRCCCSPSPANAIMAAANDLIIIFIGLEISSIASYMLAGYLRDDKRANEAALKYFLLGSFATGFFLYGVALIYGATGSINLTRGARRRGRAPPRRAPVLVGLAAALMFVGLGFKVSASPFQIWAPDVYQGAPTPVTAFLSAGPKAAAFAIFLRIFMTAFEPIGAAWEPLVWGSALLSMTIGNFAALLQTNVKRMLAYSSIAHAGYVLVALAARSRHRHGRGHVLPGRLRVHERGRVRRGQPPLRQGRAIPEHRRFRRPRRRSSRSPPPCSPFSCSR